MSKADERKLELLDQYTTYEALQESLNIRIARHNAALNRDDLPVGEGERRMHAMQSLNQLQRTLHPDDEDTVTALGLLLDGLEPDLVTAESPSL